MKAHAFVLAMALGVIGCRTVPEPTTAPTGYRGIDEVQILAKGME